MRVLVTGSEGHIGQVLAETLREAGHEVRTMDRVARHREKPGEHLAGDLRDSSAVRQAVQGVEAVAHLGAIPHDRAGSPEDVLTVNVQGTLNVLLACVEAGVGRLVYFSSINALGCVGGYRPALYFPIDDAYPRHPLSPYQISKHLGEEACRAFTDRYGLETVCLRPVFVTRPDQTMRWGQFSPRQMAEWGRVEYWASVDVRDVCEATRLALTVPGIKHDAFLLTADDTTVAVPTAELVETHYPDTPWPKIAMADYLADNPYRSLMDCTHAKEVLGWQPQHSARRSG
jgi:nucleoside-diphosphate-sugar epimerase